MSLITSKSQLVIPDARTHGTLIKREIRPGLYELVPEEPKKQEPACNKMRPVSRNKRQ